MTGVGTIVIIGSYLSLLNSDQPGTAPFPPGTSVADTCTIEPDIGYLSLKVHFSEQGTAGTSWVPVYAKIEGPDGKVTFSGNYDRNINSFFGSKPPGTYVATITSREGQEGSTQREPLEIHYDLVCITRDEYVLGQNLGGVMVVANFTYLAGVPALIYGIVRQVRAYQKSRALPEGEISSPIGLPWKIGIQKPRKRPTGVIILTILTGISGILNLSTGLGELGQASELLDSPPEVFEAFREEILGNFGSLAESHSSIIILALGHAAITLGISAVQMILVYGYLQGKGWAWSLAVIFTLILIGAIFPLGYFFSAQGALGFTIAYVVFGIIVDLIVLYYLFRPHVKAFFGRELSRPLDGSQ